MSTLVAIGTRKGLWTATSDDESGWRLSDPKFLMQEVPALAFDPSGDAQRPRLLAGVMSWHWGPTVAVSEDLGETFTETEEAAVRFPEGTDTALTRIWQLYPDPHRPGTVWAGCEPTSLFRSDDGGTTFGLVQGLWDHPHRPEWGPGFGGAAVHSVLPHPTTDGSVAVAMSTGGVYVTNDDGATWSPSNTGISAYFMPDPNPEFGQCVHKIARDAEDPDVLYAQNHHGVYRSDDGGGTWTSIAEGLPSDFGFVMLAHPRRGGTIWVVPLVADRERIPPGGRLAVHRSEDGGRSWKQLDSGLPGRCFASVLRDAAGVVDNGDGAPAGLVLGTRDGRVLASADEGDSFTLVADGLPDVLCVRAVAVS